MAEAHGTAEGHPTTFLDDAAKEVLLERCLDLVFVDDVTDLLCKRCSRVLIHHYVANCGHLFCKNCQRILSIGEQWKNKCPECKEYITNIERQEVEVERRVNELMSHCPNHKYGCKIVAKLQHIPEHLKKCLETRDANLPAYYNEMNVNKFDMHKSISEISNQLAQLSERYNEMQQLRATDVSAQERIKNKLDDMETIVRGSTLVTTRLQAEVADNFSKITEIKREAKQRSHELSSKLSEQFNEMQQLRATDVSVQEQITSRLNDMETIVGGSTEVTTRLQTEVAASSSRVTEIERELREAIKRSHELSTQLSEAEMKQSEIKASLTEKIENLDYIPKKDLQVKLDQLAENIKTELRQNAKDKKTTNQSSLELPSNNSRVLVPTEGQRRDIEDGMASVKDSTSSEYNILLLGESGAGKSLMINSIPIYLQHQTLEEALESHEIPCLIPVSFTILTEEYEEIKVTYGGHSENENHVEGGSCTLGCTSYEFQCDNCVFRFIDTPGMASTKEDKQYQQNMELIMKNINTSYYKEIHAIAIVLKANHTKLTRKLKSCLEQILTHLHSSAAPNLIFLFTHSEGTDYKPGSIMPILKKHFEEMKERSVSKVNIFMQKSNVFCVDNKVFRYLAAKTQGALSDEEEPETSYVTSYTKSANEFARLLKYVIGGLDGPGLSPHQVVDTWTINEARQFIKLVSPILKTIIENININQDHINDSVQRNEEFIDTMAKNQDFRRKKELLDTSSLVTKQWLCTSEKCKKRIVDDKGEFFYYPLICTNAKKFQWTVNSKCSICKCKKSEHKKMSALTGTKVVDAIDKIQQSAFNTALMNRSRLEQEINETEAFKRKLQDERNFIESAITTFNKFYMSHAIVLTDETNLSRAQSISPDDVKSEEVVQMKNKLFQLESFGSHIQCHYLYFFYNRRDFKVNGTVRVDNIFQLAKRFPKLNFAR